MESIAREAFKLKIQVKELEAKHDYLMKQLKIAANGETTSWGSYRIVVSSRPGVIEYNAIPQLKDVDVDMYRKPSVDVFKLEFLGE
jgi:ABC-type uncharacterized transport system auxiliary subunit